MSTEFIVDDTEMKELQEGLKHLPEDVKIVTSRAVNHALEVMRTVSWKEVSAVYNIAQHTLYDNMFFLWAKPDHLVGGLVVNAPHTPFFTHGKANFKISPQNPQPALRPTVTFAIKKGQTETIDGAFVAIMGSGHKGLFIRRKGDDTQPQHIDERFTIGAAEMVGAKLIREKVEKEGHDAFKYEFGRLADVALKKALNHPGHH